MLCDLIYQTAVGKLFIMQASAMGPSPRIAAILSSRNGYSLLGLLGSPQWVITIVICREPLQFTKYCFTVSLDYHNCPAKYVHKGIMGTISVNCRFEKERDRSSNISCIILKCFHHCSCHVHMCQCFQSDHWSWEVSFIHTGLVGISGTLL